MNLRRHPVAGLSVSRCRRPLLLTLAEALGACLAGVGLAVLITSALGLLPW